MAFVLLILVVIGTRSPPSFDIRVLGVTLCAVLPFCGLIAMFGSVSEDFMSHIRPESAERGLPHGAVREMMERIPPGNLINEYDWGGYLIYRLFPVWKVGIDGRADVHGDATMDLNYHIFSATAGWQQLVERIGATYILVRKNGRLADALKNEPSWQLLFEGDVEMLFFRKNYLVPREP